MTIATNRSVGEAEVDLKRVRELYKELGTSDNFDAAVISKNKRGRAKSDKSFEAGKRHDASMAPDLVLQPALPPRSSLRSASSRRRWRCGDRCARGACSIRHSARTKLGDQVSKNIKAGKKFVRQIADVKAEEIADEIRQARAT